MRKWKKSFRKLPSNLEVEIDRIESSNIKVLAGKIVSLEEIEDGTYSHLNLNSDNMLVGQAWEILPNPSIGIRSKRNIEGWEIVRKDLPKFTKYFYHDIAIYGDASRNGTTTAAIPREVYERDDFPPYFFHIGISIQEQRQDGSLGVVFSVDEIFSKESQTFDEDLLFAINLLQENTGVSGVVEAENPEYVFSRSIDWSVFPPGNMDEVRLALCEGRTGISQDTVSERLSLFEQFRPIEYLRGLGGNDHYIGAKYADDLVVFENLKYGNALYALYENWEELSRKPRNELLKLQSSQYDRIIHTQGWETRFVVLMQKQLEERGTRVNIGRNRRRRY